MSRENLLKSFTKRRSFGQIRRSLEIRFRHFIYRASTNTPYLSGDSLSVLTDYVVGGISGSEKISQEMVARAKSIFVRSEQLETFLMKYGDVITAKVLVTGNSDKNFEYSISIPESVKLWLCQNNAVGGDSRIKTLPIGLENLRLGRTGQTKYHKFNLGDKVRNSVLVPPMSPTNEIRRRVIQQLQDPRKEFTVSYSLLDEKSYFDLVRRFQFVLCCEGNGFDTHRLWETLYQGSFPVVLRTKWSSTLESLKLPILYIDNLEEINQTILEEFWTQHSRFDPTTKDCLWVPFWENLIIETVKLD